MNNNVYYLYIWTVSDDVEVGLYRDAGQWNEQFQRNIDTAKRHGFNYRVVRGGKTVQESIVR